MIWCVYIMKMCTNIWVHICHPETNLKPMATQNPCKLVPRNMKHAALRLAGISLLFCSLIALITPLQGSWPVLSAKDIVRILRCWWSQFWSPMTRIWAAICWAKSMFASFETAKWQETSSAQHGTLVIILCWKKWGSTIAIMLAGGNPRVLGLRLF